MNRCVDCGHRLAWDGTHWWIFRRHTPRSMRQVRLNIAKMESELGLWGAKEEWRLETVTENHVQAAYDHIARFGRMLQYREGALLR